MNNIFFDLDGTLIDASERLYKLFQDLVSESKLTKKEYWKLKRNKINHEIILNKYFPQRNFEDFNNKWLNLIETNYYLNFDKTYDGIYELLGNLKQTYNLYLLTARQSKINLEKELEKFNLQQYFTEVLVTEKIKTKEELLKRIKINTNDYFVTDMGKDIQVAQKVGIKSIAVTYGFMSRENLLKYNPTICIDDLKQIIEGIL